jgi:L-threonylcarbamoyladenylate synthase
MAKILDLKNKKECLKFIEDVSNGAVFAYPTEAVFGLGCDINNKSSINKIIELKRRKVSKGLIVISDNIEKVRNLIDDNYFKLFVENNSNAVPTTWLCPASKIVPEEITGGTKKIAIRITSHNISKLICKILDLPIISTSANISGDDPIIKQEDLEIYFRDNMDNIDYIIDGLVGNSKKPSRILDLVSKDVIREGG